MEKFLPAGMKSARKSHPWKRFFIRRDEISIIEGPAFSELPSGEILNPTTFRIDPLFFRPDFKNFEEIRGTLSL